MGKLDRGIKSVGKDVIKGVQTFAYEKYGTGAEIKWIDENHIKVKGKKHKVLAVTETTLWARIKYLLGAIAVGYILYLYFESSLFHKAWAEFKKSGLGIYTFFTVLFIPGMTVNLFIGYLYKAFNLQSEFIILTNKALIVTRWDKVFKKAKAKTKVTPSEEEELQPVSIANAQPVLKKKKRPKKALVVSYMYNLEDIDEASVRPTKLWFAPFINMIHLRTKDSMFGGITIEEVKDRDAFIELLIKAIKKRKKKLAEKAAQSTADKAKEAAQKVTSSDSSSPKEVGATDAGQLEDDIETEPSEETSESMEHDAAEDTSENEENEEEDED